ncbi:hypothetical protein M0805_001561 [Coniferiporia weirii]|nr:hypothetical protein M0805_001561 [Coniferiporia weirii]
MSLFVLTENDVSAISTTFAPNMLMSLMAFVFVKLHSRKQVALPQRTTINTDTYSALFMPARVGGYGTVVKVVSIQKQMGSIREGISATTLVLDEQTGAVRAVVNARSLTALRTAAGSALATRLIGPTAPRTLLLFGAGKQIEAHADILIRVFPSLDHCIIVNRSPNARLENLRTCLQTRFPRVQFTSGCAMDAVGSTIFDLPHAVSSADIICTATPSIQPLFKSSWVKVGAHVNLIGSYTSDMIEVEDNLIRRAGKVLVDSKEACQSEAGELIKAGIAIEDLIEIGEVVETNGEGIPESLSKVKAAGDITIFKSVGVGLQDAAIAGAIIEKGLLMGLGTHIAAYD